MMEPILWLKKRGDWRRFLCRILRHHPIGKERPDPLDSEVAFACLLCGAQWRYVTLQELQRDSNAMMSKLIEEVTR